MGRTKNIPNELKGQFLANANSTEKAVYKELQKMGFSARNIGTVYLMEVISLLILASFSAEISDKKRIRVMESVAEKHGLTVGMMNFRIRWTIDKAMEEGNVDYIYEVVGRNFEELHGYGSKRTQHFIFPVMKKVKDEMETSPEGNIEQFRSLVRESIDTATLPVLEMIYGITKFNALTEREMLA